MKRRLYRMFVLMRGECMRQARDPLAWVYLLPLMIALALRYVPPWAEVRFQIDLAPYDAPLASSFWVFGIPAMIGLAPGMLLLEERDEHVHQALLVSPLPFSSYFMVKVALPTLMSIVCSLVLYPLTKLRAMSGDPAALLLTACGASMNAPIIALIMSSVGSTKMQGFLMFRVLSGVSLFPMFTWFSQTWLHYSLAFLPAWWLHKAVWRAAEGESWLLFWCVGVTTQAALIWWLYRRWKNLAAR